EYLGAINTAVLIASSITVVLALEAAKQDDASWAKKWIGISLLLGSVFLGVKAYEYTAKFDHGIYPFRPHSRVYEKADVYYAQAVRRRLETIVQEITTDEKKINDEDQTTGLVGEALKAAEAAHQAKLDALKAKRDVVDKIRQ